MMLLHPIHIMSCVSTNTFLLSLKGCTDSHSKDYTELLPILCFGGDKMERTTVVPLPAVCHILAGGSGLIRCVQGSGVSEGFLKGLYSFK